MYCIVLLIGDGFDKRSLNENKVWFDICEVSVLCCYVLQYCMGQDIVNWVGKNWENYKIIVLEFINVFSSSILFQ